MYENMTFDNLREVLRDFAHDVGENYAAVIESNRHNASRTLSSSATDPMRQKVTLEAGSMVVSFDLPEYWKYIENGTRPHWPPLDAIARWIEIKPVIPRPGRDGRIPSPASLSYLIRRKIANVGTEGTHDLRAAREHTLPWWYDRIKAAMLQDVADQFADTILKVGGGKVIEFPL